ncbi:bacillithiol system protein YtxJ [Salinibacillus kushneri]|uniref:Bacillithiol system protein YtxJ n=1 Tax=Salinibacillus kushneri TaxID=237682 RepID=A0A1I0JCA6_9BACI|nr:bacillithiol system redox-active protein YtxJ [Salinibacillus kushneri]SEU07664.1 bacillithiol system protein YtxJ [Salinibacillus kushneri]
MQILENSEDLKRVVEQQECFFLLKHSLTCPISAEAKQQYESFAGKTDTPLYILHVQEARPLSNEIAATYGIKHESPQALFFNQNHIVWDASHWDITVDILQKIDQKYEKKIELNVTKD